MEAEKIGHKAATLGFEWPDIEGVLDKLQEEAAELAQARKSEDRGHIEHELGDLLFTVVNLARFLKVDPEQALRKTSARFRRRFAMWKRRWGRALRSKNWNIFGRLLSSARVPCQMSENKGRPLCPHNTRL